MLNNISKLLRSKKTSRPRNDGSREAHNVWSPNSAGMMNRTQAMSSFDFEMGRSHLWDGIAAQEHAREPCCRLEDLMKPNNAQDELHIKSLLRGAINHSSQVTSAIKNMLSIPLPVLTSMCENAKQYIVRELKGIDERTWPRIDMAPIIREQHSFQLRPNELVSVEILDCHDFVLDLEQINQKFELARRAKFVIIIRNCKNFLIKGGYFSHARNVCIIENSERFAICHLKASHTEGYGIILLNSRFFEIMGCLYLNGLASGLYCLGSTTSGWIHHNSYQGGTGFCNCDAGVHLNHCSPHLTFDQIPEQSHENKRIAEKTLKPMLLFVENNLFLRNAAQGIYCEGAVLCTFKANTLMGNNKEGICFDWGSALNVFDNNMVTENGARAHLSEAAIKADFIEQYPVLGDASSSCKLPGVSIDNGAVNFIARNKIQMNHGGGIKMVRTGIANLISENVIIDNALGRNEHFPSFHGISYLGMGAGVTEFRNQDAMLDFCPSEHNYCFRNTFRVDRRDLSIFHDECSTNNLEYGNVTFY